MEQDPIEKECIFCQIIRGERPAEIVYRDDRIVAFKDGYPRAPVHLLIVPKKHIRSINDLTEDDSPIISAMILKGKDLAREFGIALSGYRLTCNVERGAGQVVFHLHLHLTGGMVRRPG